MRERELDCNVQSISALGRGSLPESTAGRQPQFDESGAQKFP